VKQLTDEAYDMLLADAATAREQSRRDREYTVSQTKSSVFMANKILELASAINQTNTKADQSEFYRGWCGCCEMSLAILNREIAA
jgi:hypothetical protein